MVENLDIVIEGIKIITIGVGFYFTTLYLKKISVNQSLCITNSHNNKITVFGNRDNKDIELFNRRISREEDFLPLIQQLDKTKDANLCGKKLLAEIREYLREEKPMHLVAEMCLDLAKELHMQEEVEWLSYETMGLNPDKEKFYNVEAEKRFKNNRRIDAELDIKFNDLAPRSYDIPLVIAWPLNRIQMYAEQESPAGKLILYGPPIKPMIEVLNVNQTEKIPYVIASNSMKNILINVRGEINRFIGDAEKNYSCSVAKA